MILNPGFPIKMSSSPSIDGFSITVRGNATGITVRDRTTAYYVDSSGVIKSLNGNGTFAAYGPFIILGNTASLNGLTITVSGGAYEKITDNCYFVSPTDSECTVSVKIGSSGGLEIM